jgi:hypothetical protein
MSANLAGNPVEVLISLPTSWPQIWRPTDLTPDGWRVVAYPFYRLPAWWLVGRGLDGLLRRKRLHLSMVVIGSILALACLAFFIGILSSPAGDRADMVWILPGAGFWALAFAVLPFAAVLQRMRKRRAGAAQTAQQATSD